MRQEWIQKGCDKGENQVVTLNSCPIPGRKKIGDTTPSSTSFNDHGKGHYDSMNADDIHHRLHGDEVSMRKVNPGMKSDTLLILQPTI